MKSIRRILLVSGGRDNADPNLIIPALEDWKPHLIIHGGALGTDTIANSWACQNGVVRTIFEASKEDYKLYGKQAPLMRNTDMVEHAVDTYCDLEGWPPLYIARYGYTVEGMFFPGKNGTRDCHDKWIAHHGLIANIVTRDGVYQEGMI